jgi:leader peptidase (prepilin peptidase)/N-methyltransferase
VFTRGRCRSCGAAIPKLHISIEVGAAALAALAVALQPSLHGAALATFWLLLVAPAVLDARHHWLPDPLTAVLALAGLGIGGVATGSSITERLIGGAAGFLALWFIAFSYRRSRGREGLGAGDPKLLGAIGLWTGWLALPAVLLIAALAGLAVAVAQGRSRLDRMPFGTLLAAAAVLWTAVLASRAPVLDGAQLFEPCSQRREIRDADPLVARAPERRWIDRLAEAPDLEVHMRTSRQTTRPHKADQLAAPHP